MIELSKYNTIQYSEKKLMIVPPLIVNYHKGASYYVM